VLEEYPNTSKPSLEADDVIGILATKPGNKCLIWSTDKDLKQIPGYHLIEGGREFISKSQGDYFHLQQTLTGDAVDGYPGCPGVGPVTAVKILSNEPTGPIDPEITWVEWHWTNVVKAYEKKGLTEADALVQAQIARICQWENWDQTNQEVIKWLPSSK
jgi:DNA polymerase-1